jgi:hypothetical protein
MIFLWVLQRSEMLWLPAYGSSKWLLRLWLFSNGKYYSRQTAGRTIDFPTANLEIAEDYKLIPQNGVYIVKSTINEQIVLGWWTSGLTNSKGQNSNNKFIILTLTLIYTIKISVLASIAFRTKIRLIELLSTTQRQKSSIKLLEQVLIKYKIFLNFHKTLPFFFKFENNTFFIQNILFNFKNACYETTQRTTKRTHYNTWNWNIS